MNSSTNTPKIYFRLDCGGMIGFGHFSRCSSLAEELVKRNFSPVFIIRKRPSLKDFKPSFPVIWLEEVQDVHSDNVETWKNNSELHELEEILQVMDPESIFILDHYGLQKTFQNAIRAKGHKLILIQDIFSEDFSADLLINYTLEAKALTFNQASVGKLLLGPEYTLLNSAYSENHDFNFKKGDDVKRVGVYLGGIKIDYVGLVASALSEIEYFKNKEIEWVVNSEEEKTLVSKKLILEHLTIKVRVPGLIPLYKNSQLFIGTCGVSTFERACLGLWQLNFSMADNQKVIVKNLLDKDVSFYLGDLRSLSKDSVVAAIKSALVTPVEIVEKKVRKFFELIDGKGAHAISDVIATMAVH